MKPRAPHTRASDLPETNITVNQMAYAFGVDRKTVIKWAQSGVLGPVLVLPNGSYRFDREQLARFRRDQMRAPLDAALDRTA